MNTGNITPSYRRRLVSMSKENSIRALPMDADLGFSMTEFFQLKSLRTIFDENLSYKNCPVEVEFTFLFSHIQLRISEIFEGIVCMPLQIYILGFQSICRKQVFKPFVNFFRSSQIQEQLLSRKVGKFYFVALMMAFFKLCRIIFVFGTGRLLPQKIAHRLWNRVVMRLTYTTIAFNICVGCCTVCSNSRYGVTYVIIVIELAEILFLQF